MDILAISYSNIGPFENQLITVDFKKGKFLIKSPIGKGKSFLFFDGPVFGLYKYSSRTILNRKSQEGFVKVLLQVGDEIFLVERYITPTKAGGDSVQTRLFKIQKNDFELNLPEIINFEKDIYNILQELKADIQEIQFKSGNELQASLDLLLPPREVFLSVNFLMQESDNIFEMTPADRINIFKNIFGLLGIDEAKEMISEKRKEVQLNLKLKQDSSSFDEKLKNNIALCFSIREKIISSKDQFKDLDFEKIINMVFFDEMDLIKDKVNIRDFDITDIDLKSFEKIFDQIEKQKAGYQEQLGTVQTLKKSYQEQGNRLSILKSQKAELEQQKQDLEMELKDFDPKKQEVLEQKKQIKQEEYDKIIDDIISKNKNLGVKITDIYELVNLIDTFIQQGKTQKAQLGTLQLKKENFDEKKESLQSQLDNIQVKTKDLDENLKQQTSFFCEKIGVNCPYVDVIKADSLQVLNKQKQQLQLEYDTISQSLEKLDYQAQIKTLNNEEKLLNNDIQKLSDFFNSFDRKYIKDDFENVYKPLERDITHYETITKQQETKTKTLQDLASKIVNLGEQIEQLSTDLSKLSTQIADQEQLLKIFNMEEISQVYRNLDELKKAFEYIVNLVQEYKAGQLELQKLQEDEKIYNELYQIFSKEIMLVVLQEFLPSLSELINSYLARIVDYELKFDLIKKASDKLELDIQIIDNKGPRNVKSLSGGQKTVLKLVWILSVSSIMRSKFLFLDETINNLDYDTIGRVSDFLQDFVKSNDVKFYVVTHSKQIQDMDIWDGEVQID